MGDLYEEASQTRYSSLMRQLFHLGDVLLGAALWILMTMLTAFGVYIGCPPKKLRDLEAEIQELRDIVVALTHPKPSAFCPKNSVLADTHLASLAAAALPLLGRLPLP